MGNAVSGGGGLGPVVLSGTAANGDIIEATSATAAIWTVGGGGPPTGAAGGVLAGTYPNPGIAASTPLTGTPTAPTAAALTDSTQIATTAYADAAVAVETSRAEAAEALLAPLQAASAGFTPANPTPTTSTTLVMMGLGSTCVYTPSGTGKVLVLVSAQAQSVTALQAITIGMRFGTGAAPANGVAVTGTRFGSVGDLNVRASVVGSTAPFSAVALLTGLTPGTQIWADIAAATASAADAAAVVNASFVFAELPS